MYRNGPKKRKEKKKKEEKEPKKDKKKTTNYLTGLKSKSNFKPNQKKRSDRINTAQPRDE